MTLELNQEGATSLGCIILLNDKPFPCSGLELMFGTDELAELVVKGGALEQIPWMHNVKCIHLEIEWEDE